MCDSLFEKDMFAKIKLWFEDQVTYKDGTVVNYITPLNQYTYGLY